MINHGAEIQKNQDKGWGERNQLRRGVKPLKDSHLLILNYEMNLESQVFAHQIGVVNKLSKYFQKVTVLTGKALNYQVNSNVQVISSGWQYDRKLSNISRLVLIFCRIIFSRNVDIVFSHMTSVQSAITSPLTRILGIKHYLWYAHASNNLALKISYLFTDKILTATSGSCPIKKSKVNIIGHSVDSQIFKKKNNISYPVKNFIHIGRFDPSKNIDGIIQVIHKTRNIRNDLTLQIVGEPMSKEGTDYQFTVKKKYFNSQHFNWLNFQKAVTFDQVPKLLYNSDGFIHSFNGSLDKAIIEATLVGIPVVTINKEFINVFGCWSKKQKYFQVSLEEELEALLTLDQNELEDEIQRRYKIALGNFEIQGWINKVVTILQA